MINCLELKKYIFLLKKEEKEIMSKQNNVYKSIILKIYTKVLSVESEELENKNEINNLSMQILNENKYLRKGCESIIGDAFTKGLSNNDSNTNKDSNVPIKKKKRNPTQINFDFLNKDNQVNAIEKDNKNSENTTINQV